MLKDSPRLNTLVLSGCSTQPVDLLPLCEELDIPLVFDYHHDDIHPGPLVNEGSSVIGEEGGEGSVVVDPLAIVDEGAVDMQGFDVGTQDITNGAGNGTDADADVGETQATDVDGTQATGAGTQDPSPPTDTQVTDALTHATEDPPTALLNELGYRSVPQGAFFIDFSYILIWQAAVAFLVLPPLLTPPSPSLILQGNLGA